MILVTGATGHIGNVLVRKLKLKGEDVRVLTLPQDDLQSIKDVDVEIVTGDITQPKTLLPALDDVELVFHLAGLVSILPQHELLNRINVQGTINMIEASLKKDLERFIYISSVHALKEPPHGIVIDESCPYEPTHARGAYDRSKAQASLEVLKSIENGLDAVIACPSGVLGPYDYKISQMGKLIIDYLQGNLKAYLDGAYDFVDVRDVAHGLILVSEKGKKGNNYILSGEKIKVSKLLRLLQDNTGINQPKVKIPFWMARTIGKITPFFYRNTKKRPLFTSYSAEVLLSNSDISSAKARQELGYHPRPIKETIHDTVKWFKKHPEVYKNL